MIRFAWPCLQSVTGAAFGYTRAQHGMFVALRQAGAIYDVNADIVVQLTTINNFAPAPGKFNVLYTMNESLSIAPWALDKLHCVDAIFVPTEWNARLIRRYVDESVPIRVVPLGIDTDFYVGVERERPKDRPVQFLWLGAQNDRKGWRQLMEVWREGGFYRRNDVCLYMKTTSSILEEDMPRVLRRGNVTTDNRVLSEIDLLRLYVTSDIFVWPSWGEGWGLPLMEAMATAMPCITGDWTAMSEYVTPEVAYVLESELSLAQVRDAPDSDWLHFEYVHVPKKESLVAFMNRAVQEWDQSVEMGKRAWALVQQFSWRRAGERLLEALVDVTRGGSHAVS